MSKNGRFAIALQRRRKRFQSFRRAEGRRRARLRYVFSKNADLNSIYGRNVKHSPANLGENPRRHATGTETCRRWSGTSLAWMGMQSLWSCEAFYPACSARCCSPVPEVRWGIFPSVV